MREGGLDLGGCGLCGVVWGCVGLCGVVCGCVGLWGWAAHSSSAVSLIRRRISDSTHALSRTSTDF
jgi:hypothetical protein